ILHPKQMPLAVARPTRSEVYDPGPLLTATADRSLYCISCFLIRSSIITANSSACRLTSRDSSNARKCLPSYSATEHTSVEDSMQRISGDNLLLFLEDFLIPCRIPQHFNGFFDLRITV